MRAPEKGVFFLETDFHDHHCFFISHSNVVLNFGLKICAGETSASPCLSLAASL